MREKHEKTNAMRALDRVKADYATHSYGDGEAVSGVEVAHMLGQDERRVFKTLVTEGKSRAHYVFMVPVAEELDLKKAGRLRGRKGAFPCSSPRNSCPSPAMCTAAVRPLA